MPEHLRISFRSSERLAVLGTANRFLAELPDYVEVERGTYFRKDGSGYIDVVADRETVELALAASAHPAVSTKVEERVAEEPQAECVSCGNVPDEPVTVCPACDFREIQACPHCSAEVARTEYVDVEPGLQRCPSCGNRVRLAFVDPLFDDAGFYYQPLIVVSRA